MSTPHSILKNVFGFETFRPHQLDVIESILKKRDCLAVMPTGGGKSLCYQIPALLQDGLTVVVSPLIALMKDQVEQLRDYGVPAVVLNSSIPRHEYQANIRAVQSGEARLVYMAPETLLAPRTLSLLSTLKIDLLTVDEAHCISEWGHDFRPEYRRVIEVREKLPPAVCLAMTATATPRVREDIRTSLKLASSREIVASFNRENLYIEVAPKQDAIRQTEHFLERVKGQSGIIYCFSRKQVDQLSAYLALQGRSVKPYHAGLDDIERRKNQEAFIRDDVQIMIATIAFGMGINKPNVRFVVHFDLPKSIEGYYQEIGRAGRDGLPAHCLLLYSYADVLKLRHFIDQKEDGEQKVAMAHLESIVRYAEDDANCRRRPLLAYFGESFTARNCDNCDNCTRPPDETADITVPAQKFLSCVMRTGGRFGAAHVADVLLGSNGEKVLKFRHERLTTFGIGKELTRDQWMGLARQLVKLGLLDQELKYRTLNVTPKAVEVLKTRAPIMGASLEVVDRTRSRKEKPRESAIEFDQTLFEQLRQKRKELAVAADVPPYVIFSDRTLVEMAAYYPQDGSSLMRITGVGEVKAERYGKTFLALIREYCQVHNLSENFPASAGGSPRNGELRMGGKRYRDLNSRSLVIGEAYNAGKSVKSLMLLFQIKLGTILDHLTKYIGDGNRLRCRDDLRALVSAPNDVQEKAFEAFDEFGLELLKPVFDKLDGRATYDDLRILRILYVNRDKQ
jgi:ATP-dependent DNA helicase RecQ